MTNLKRYGLPLVVLALGIGISAVTLAATPAATLRKTIAVQNIQIEFPIPELGNCTDKASCKTYCDSDEHIGACVTFAETHGLISPEDAENARTFADVLRGEGPGGCVDKTSCEAYCEDLAHADTCLAFAEKHGFLPADELAQAKKVAAALAAGGKLPGGCKNKIACEAYCKDGKHMEECLLFAEQSGFLPPGQIAEARKVLPFLTSGTTPGKCATKDECETYCKDSTHFEECVSFAEKAGFIDAEDAALARKAGGSGPGGCRSKAACETYCNESDHAAECFSFAKAKGILSPEKIKEIEEGMGRLRAGLTHMPPEMVDCLKQSLGQNIVAEIEAGTLTPGPAIGDKVKACVEQSLPALRNKISAALKMASPETMACLTQGLGAEGLAKIQNGEAPTPEMGDVLRKCFESLKAEGLKKAMEGLAKVPPEMRACVEQKLGAEKIAKIQAGDAESVGPEVGDAFKSCVSAVKESIIKESNAIYTRYSSAPPEVKTCIEAALEGVEDKIQSGAIDGPEDVQPLIQKCMQGFTPPAVPSGLPSGMPPLDSGSVPPGAGTVPPPDIVPDSSMCANFAMAPSCEYVPENVRELCRKCKGN